MAKRGTKVSTRQRASGKWEYRFEGAAVDGKRKWISKGGFNTSHDAYEAGVDAYKQYKNTGKRFTPSEVSVSDYMDYWLSNYCKTNLKKTTVEGYEKKIRLYIKPAIGSYYLKDIDTATIQKFIDDMFNNGYSRNTLTSVKGIICKSFDYAYNVYHFIGDDPSIRIKLPLGRAKPKNKPTAKKERTVYTKEQIKAIFERFPEGHTCHLPLMLAYRCGTRLGEAFAITWEDIDFENKTLRIGRQVQSLNNAWYIFEPKYDSFRTIDLDDEMLGLLVRTKEHQDRAKEFYRDMYTQMYAELMPDQSLQINDENRGEPIHLINTRENGTYIQPRVLQHCFRIIHYQLGFPDTDYHSLRHTHASDLLAAGINPKYVQERLGHKNIETTLQVYAHVNEAMKEQSLDILNRMYL